MIRIRVRTMKQQMQTAVISWTTNTQGLQHTCTCRKSHHNNIILLYCRKFYCHVVLKSTAIECNSVKTCTTALQSCCHNDRTLSTYENAHHLPRTTSSDNRIILVINKLSAGNKHLGEIYAKNDETLFFCTLDFAQDRHVIPTANLSLSTVLFHIKQYQ